MVITCQPLADSRKHYRGYGHVEKHDSCVGHEKHSGGDLESVIHRQPRRRQRSSADWRCSSAYSVQEYERRQDVYLQSQILFMFYLFLINFSRPPDSRLLNMIGSKRKGRTVPVATAECCSDDQIKTHMLVILSRLSLRPT